MGPGFHAELERASFQGSLPQIDFWNQPRVESFRELVAKATEKVSSLYNVRGEKIALMGHSFGAQIAFQLSLLIPEKIQKINLINGAVDPFECFLNLRGHLIVESQFPMTSDQLRASDTDTKMSFIMHLAPYVTADKYWYDMEKFQKYSKDAQGYPSLDVGAFIAVFSDFLKTQKPKVVTGFTGKVGVFAGLNDKLLDLKKDIQPWLKCYPGATVETIDSAGHFPYFENAEVVQLLFT